MPSIKEITKQINILKKNKLTSIVNIESNEIKTLGHLISLFKEDNENLNLTRTYNHLHLLSFSIENTIEFYVILHGDILTIYNTNRKCFTVINTENYPPDNQKMFYDFLINCVENTKKEMIAYCSEDDADEIKKIQQLINGNQLILAMNALANLKYKTIDKYYDSIATQFREEIE